MIVELLLRGSLPFLSMYNEVREEGPEEGIRRVKNHSGVGKLGPVASSFEFVDVGWSKGSHAFSHQWTKICELNTLLTSRTARPGWTLW